MPRLNEITGLKVCTSCRTAQPITGYHADRRTGDGLSSRCKSCESARNKIVRSNAEFRKKAAAYAIVYRRKNVDRLRKNRRKRMYGVSAKQFDLIFASQGFACGICGTTEPKKTKFNHVGFAVDHDHKTGAVRGILCGNCNNLLGHAKDDERNLMRAILYLDRHKLGHTAELLALAQKSELVEEYPAELESFITGAQPYGT